MRTPIELTTGTDVKRFSDAVQHVECDVRLVGQDEKDYYLVHGFPGENVHDEVWTRPAIDTANPMPGTILIIGHTPVLHMQCAKEDREDRIAEMIRNGEHPQILHAPGFINIDCGCSYDDPIKTLGCLRLDDMEAFYTHNSLR